MVTGLLVALFPAIFLGGAAFFLGAALGQRRIGAILGSLFAAGLVWTMFFRMSGDTFWNPLVAPTILVGVGGAVLGGFYLGWLTGTGIWFTDAPFAVWLAAGRRGRRTGRHGSRRPRWLTVLLTAALLVPFLAYRLRLPLHLPRSRPAALAAPADRVGDFAGVLSADERAALRDLAAKTEARTSDELAVAVIPSLAGDDVAEVARSLFSGWGVGKKGRDNGVLLLVAVKERVARLEVGYGLERELPDGVCGSLLAQRLMPAWRGGRVGSGIVATVRAVAERLGLSAGGPMPLTTAAARRGVSGIDDGAGIMTPEAVDHVANEIGLMREREGVEVRVVTVPSLDGRPVELAAAGAYRTWTLPAARKARAVLLFAAAREAAVFLIVPEGLRDRVTPGQSVALAAQCAAELRRGNPLGAFWGTTADLDAFLAGRARPVTGSTSSQLEAARRHAERGMVGQVAFSGLFVLIGACVAGASVARRQVGALVFGAAFVLVPIGFFDVEFLSWGAWWPALVHLGLAAVVGLAAWRLGRRFPAVREPVPGRWSWGLGMSVGGRGGGRAGGFGGGRSGGGGAERSA